MAVKWVVAYDVADDDRRARIAAVLSAWGDRIQKSVFECDIDPDDFGNVRERVEAIMDPTTDVVQFLGQCGHCQSERIDLGQAQRASADPFWII